jgi:cyanate permease
MGVILGSWQLVYIFFAQPAGIIIDRIGPYRSLVIGVLIISVSAALRWFADSFVSLFLLVALFGIGGPMISIGLPKLTSLWFIGRERGTASGIIPTGNAIGGMVALSITSNALMPWLGDWKIVFLVYSGIGFAVAGIWFIFGRRTPNTSFVDQMPHHNLWDLMRTLFRHKNIWLIVSIGLTSFLAGHGLSNWLPTILEDKGIQPNDAGYMTSILKLFGILGSLLIPRLQYQLHSKKKAISITLFSLGLSITTIALTNGAALWLAMALAGVMMRGLLPLLTVTLMDLPEVGPSRMGIIGGLYFSIGEIGGFSGPFILGISKELTNSFIPGLIFFAIVSEAAILLTILLDFSKTGNSNKHSNKTNDSNNQ